ncbi:MAG: sigma-70 family RNA polymerase sigma factor [Rhodospirillales bacterium]|nr:sigma-70 family RNA polymerase sigma factor [Rhodospirillales bacterium]
MVQKTKRIFESYLVSCAQLGDRVAQEQLVNRYQKKFHSHACRLLGDVEQTRDAVQDGWVEIVRNLPKLKDESAFQAWAFRIITRKCTQLIGRLQKNRRILAGVLSEPAKENRTVDDIEQAVNRTSIHEALANLPIEHRVTTALFYLEELSIAEVAIVLEIPMGTVKSRLMHARKRLRVALEGDDNG